MTVINADLKYYNANTRDARVGDCVKRGLAVAYSMDYDKVSAELNQIKRSLGISAYNLSPVFEAFMKRRGDKFTRVDQADQITADEFCKQHPSGVFIVLVGKSISSRSTHLAAIVDGDLFDSWDSLDWFVKAYSYVSSGKSDVYDFDVESICKSVAQSVSEYVDSKISAKMPDNMHVHVSGSLYHEEKYSYELTVVCELGETSRYSRYRSNRKLNHHVLMKTNPRLSEEENIASLTKKTKQKVYDWIYNIKAELAEGEKIERLGVNRHFYCNRAAEPILGKLPDWAIPHVTRIWDNGKYNAYGRFEIEMEALPDDPRYEELHHVDFYADTLRELKSQLEYYKERYLRINYDY